MKIWTSEHVFDHDWETVVNAAWRKYPNPMNQGVTGMDVLRQTLQAGKILSERIIQSHFHIPSWATKLTGFSGTQYSHEFTVIDPQQRTMSLTTRNLNGSSFLRVDEKLTYTPLPEDPSKTVLKQEAVVTITLPAFVDYCEKTFIGVYSSNAAKGRKGVEWVIDQLKNEYTDISTKVSVEVLEMQEKVMNAFKGAQSTSPISP
ncbi:PRELI-like family protein [Necator americanus]|uniref:PRELI-like family protein n=1 Tax=Necator americanus TaxID=51031 RepID=W2TRN0_NECAM|nr:PRELI-like family protein [Necator americanus]ETN84314.1 PRELI-like family protein [Necator americanus]